MLLLRIWFCGLDNNCTSYARVLLHHSDEELVVPLKDRRQSKVVDHYGAIICSWSTTPKKRCCLRRPKHDVLGQLIKIVQIP